MLAYKNNNNSQIYKITNKQTFMEMKCTCFCCDVQFSSVQYEYLYCAVKQDVAVRCVFV